MTKREAWNALDQARTKAWRKWRENLFEMKRRLVPFEVAEEWTAWMLLQDLQPWYNMVKDAE